jgi:hypothetical protein
MSVTIYYNGKLDERARLPELLDAARFYCAEERWHCLDVEERILGHVERTAGPNPVEASTQSFPIDDSMQGILITPHRESEPIRLTFNEAGELAYYMPLNDLGDYLENKTLFTGTQFARVATHIAVCEFLHFIQDNYMPGLHVYDEGGFFESGDETTFVRSFDTLDFIMDPVQTTPEEEAQDAPADRTRGIDDADLIIGDLAPGDPPKRKRKALHVEPGSPINLPKPRWKRRHGASAHKE